MTGSNNAYYIRYAHTRRKRGYILIPIYTLLIAYRFLYIKNVTLVDDTKIIRLYIIIRIFFENPFLDKKNIIKNETDKNKTDKDKIENKIGDKNKAE